MVVTSFRRAGWMLLLTVVLGMVGRSTACAQDTTRVLTDIGLHRDTIDTFQPQPYHLQPFVLPGSERIRVGTTRLDTSEYRLDARHGRLWVHREDLVGAHDTLFAAYRTYPFALDTVYGRRAADTSSATDTTGVSFTGDAPSTSSFDPFEGIDLERSGSISRSLVGGSNRDVTIESGLKMQLEGEVADSVFVRALLTDENTPIQPEGTTQRLQDFDRVFLQVAAPEGSARLGDVDVNIDGGQFAQFTQKVQGATVTSDALRTSPGIVAGEATAFGAVSRGQYRTQDITPRDGVQGPYQLRGREGTETIIVVAGSERVYLDGERLTRGRTQDYVIDYTQAEITFTSNRLITDDRRITVEFQYSATQFSRTLMGAHVTTGAWRRDDGEPRVSVGASVIRQADGRNFQAAFDLSRQDSLQLVHAGDEQAVRSGARRVDFDPEAPYVHYRRTEVAVPGGTTDTAFVALDGAPEEETAVYRVRFTRVGPGQGRYDRVGSAVNGVVYEYRGPGEGAYEPVEPLPAPTRQRLVDLTGAVEPVEGLELFGEWARSVNDQNRFSTLDAANDQGRAYVAGIRLSPTPLDVGDATLGQLSGRVRRQYRGSNFVTFDQTRPIEYGRRWNLSRSGSDLPERFQGGGAETVDQGEVALDWADGSSLEVGMGRLAIGRTTPVFEAWRRRGQIQIEEAGWPRLSLRSDYVTSTDRLEQVDGAWLRQRATVRQPLLAGTIEPRVAVEHEQRAQRALGTDSLRQRSVRFLEVRPGISMQTGALQATSSLEYRTEDGPAAGDFQSASRAWTAKTEVSYDPSSPYDVSVQGGYRTRRVTDYFRRTEQRRDTESVLLQLRGRARPLDRAIDASLFYDAATERTPILREVYVQTRPNVGQYVWRDANGDGLQQIDEFVPETTPNEGEYVQRFVPSDTLESVVNLQARMRLELHPRRLWSGGDTWWKQWLRQVTTETNVEVQEKNRAPDPAEIYRLELDRFRQPGRTLDGSLRLEQRVELFRPRRAYGIDVTWWQTRGLTERAAGQERQFLNRWEAEARLQPGPAWGLEVTGTAGRDRVQSEAFSVARSYDIRTRKVRPSLSYQPRRTLEFTLSGVYARKRERTEGRQADIVRVPLEVTWSRVNRLRLTANAEVARVALEGAAVGRALFELTDGRGPGTSYLWGLQGRYAFGEHLQATLSYDGRAPAIAPAIHTARIQFSASF